MKGFRTHFHIQATRRHENFSFSFLLSEKFSHEKKLLWKLKFVLFIAHNLLCVNIKSDKSLKIFSLPFLWLTTMNNHKEIMTCLQSFGHFHVELIIVVRIWKLFFVGIEKCFFLNLMGKSMDYLWEICDYIHWFL